MRTLTLVLALLMLPTGCSLPPREAAPLDIQRVPDAAPRQPPTIRRMALHDVLRKGAGRFFARMPVEPYRAGRRLVGFRLLGLYANAPPHPDGVHVGDVVTAVNDMPILRPGQFMKVWEAVGRAPAIEVDVLRDQRPFRVVYRIVD